MKFNVTRKICLTNIDKKIWPYETEDLGVIEADSFEEAYKIVDPAVAERIGYYRAKAEAINNAKTKPKTPKLKLPDLTPAPAPTPILSQPATALPPMTPPMTPSDTASQPPVEFQV